MGRGRAGCSASGASPGSLCESGLAPSWGWGGRAANPRGNLDLPPALPFLGKTQLQILSFITSAILMVAHGFTSWAVTERVLLRDEWALRIYDVGRMLTL